MTLPPKLSFDPPLLNSATPWATDIEDLIAIASSPSTGAVTTRTSLINGFDHQHDNHQYLFFDPASTVPGKGTSSTSTVPACNKHDDTASLNNLGYSPIPLDGYLGFLTQIAQRLPQLRKTFIVSVTGSPQDIQESYARIEKAAASLPFPLAMEINLSCPNIPGAPPPAYDGTALESYLALLPKKPTLPIGIKTPPYTHHGQFSTLIAALAKAPSSLSFITATNTLGSCLILEEHATGSLSPQLPNLGVGGMAGPPLHPLALGNVSTLRKLLDQVLELSHIRIIGVGGVRDGAGYRRMRAVGAYAVAVGTGLGSIYWHTQEEEEKEPECCYDSSVISPSDLSWLSDVTLLVEDPDGSKSADLVALEITYDVDYETPISFPLHDACIHELRQIVAPKTLDLEALYTVFQSLFEDDGLHDCLNIDYGGAEAFMMQYWVVDRGAEEFVTSPISTAELRRWYASVMGILPGRGVEEPVIQLGPDSKRDPFSGMPSELLLHMMEYMSMAEACSWREASRSVARLVVGRSFWESKFHQDMPWAYDFIEPTQPLDWEAFYKAVYRAACTKGAHKHRTLANRRRIWGIFSQILSRYEAAEASIHKARAQPPPTFADAARTPPFPSTFDPETTSSRDLVFIRDFDDLESCQHKLVFTWDDIGILRNVDVSYKPGVVTPYHTNKDRVLFPSNGWPTGFLVTTGRPEGTMFENCIFDIVCYFSNDQPERLQYMEGVDHDVHARQGHFIVGLTVFKNSSGIVVGLGLIEQPVSKVADVMGQRVLTEHVP
ncbi:dihydroorotate dehydrogenase (fumarate) [Fusarium albosuccineum]|uniref:Dihydroorotate dehydrogenase (fumarate) n=1 Tax=Fusarium albosuccineum TaxID=1237068 RepID=A0A8H4KZH1_9HYPO|nr:dihydroorotate dehydrogenase (fumarate) [Fusarium albosuccineum]